MTTRAHIAHSSTFSRQTELRSGKSNEEDEQSRVLLGLESKKA